MVLFEAKLATASDARYKVVGQILSYYGAALELGENGIAYLRKYAGDDAGAAAETLKSVKKYTSVSPPAEGWKAMREGTKLGPEEIKLFVALDGDPPHSLRLALDVLKNHHGLNIGLIVVRDGTIDVAASILD